MSRSATPWFWEERNSYYVTICGKRHRLGEDKKEALRLFHELMSAKPVAVTTTATGISVAELFDKYLDWCEKHRAKETYLWARKRIQSFCDHLGKRVSMAASTMKPYHVSEWCDAHDSWGANHKRGGIIAVQRPFG